MRNSSRTSLKLKKRWFLLTHNSLDYYKSSERHALKLGTLVLNSLCSVVPPDDRVFKETGQRPSALRPGISPAFTFTLTSHYEELFFRLKSICQTVTLAS